MMTAFASCARKFHTEFVLGLRPPVPSIDLHAGGCVAKAIEVIQFGVWFEELSFAEALLRGHAAFCMEWGDFSAEKETPKTLDNTWSAIELYFQTFPPDRDHVQPYRLPDNKPTLEFSFAVPLEPAVNPEPDRGYTHASAFPLHPSGDPFLWAGRFDLLGLLRNKHACVRDEKTTSRLATNWADQWNLRRQFLGYHWACQSLGIPVEATIVRGIVIRSPTAPTGKGNEIIEAEKFYSADLIAKWHEQTRHDLWRLRRCWDTGYWDYNLGEACTQYGLCPFMDLCESPRPEQWYDNFVVRRWSPLQLNPEDEAHSNA